MIRKLFYLVFFISLFFNSFCYARSNEYYRAVLVNTISDECRKSNKCLEEIIEGEINYATKLYLVEVLKIFENSLKIKPKTSKSGKCSNYSRFPLT